MLSAPAMIQLDMVCDSQLQLFLFYWSEGVFVHLDMVCDSQLKLFLFFWCEGVMINAKPRIERVFLASSPTKKTPCPLF